MKTKYNILGSIVLMILLSTSVFAQNGELIKYMDESEIKLSEKVTGHSGIELNPEGEVAFVSAVSADAIFAIDLNNQEIIKKIDCERPYFMIIP